jgi:hypothetical protein
LLGGGGGGSSPSWASGFLSWLQSLGAMATKEQELPCWRWC